MSKKIDKEELRGPDGFVSFSDKVFEHVARHFKAAVIAVAIILLGSIGYVGFGYIKTQKEMKAAEALYPAEAELKKAQGKDEEAIAKVVALQPEEYQKKFASAVSQLIISLQANDDTKAAMVSALNLSSFLMQQKQYAEAMKVLEIPKFKPSDSDLLAGFWYMHQGLVMIENQKVDQAMTAYQSLLKNSSLKLFHPEAQLKIGLCYELKGDMAKAREIYEKVEREYPDTESSLNAQQYLRVLHMKSSEQG